MGTCHICTAPMVEHPQRLRVCEAVDDIDDPHHTRVWEVCVVYMHYRARGKPYWACGGTLSTHDTWRDAMDAAGSLVAATGGASSYGEVVTGD